MTDVREVTRTRAQPESNTGIRNKGLRHQLYLRKERRAGNGIRGGSKRQELRLGGQKILYEILGQILDSEVVKRAVGIMSVRTLLRCRPPLKRKESLLATLE